MQGVACGNPLCYIWNMKRMNLVITDEHDKLAALLAKKLSARSHLAVGKPDVYRLALLAMAKKEKVSA